MDVVCSQNEITFPDTTLTEAVLYLWERGQIENTRIGLKGVFQFSNSGNLNLPEALRGEWLPPNEFFLEYNEAADNQLYFSGCDYQSE